MPKHVALGHMFGSPVAFTVPDLDRTDYLVIIGANPLVSNGSLATAADFPGKLRALRKRGGRLTVIDPARTRTAELADRHIAPRPGTDAALLFAVVHVLFEEGLVAPDLGGIGRPCQRPRRRPRPCRRVRAGGRQPTYCGVAADEIRALARELAAAPTAAVYGRIGTSTVEFGTLGSWLVDVVNVLTGNLDRPGGAMFPLGARGACAAATETGPRLQDRPLAQPGVGLSRSAVRIARCRTGRGDRHPGRRPDQGDDHHRRKPRAVGARRRPARPGARRRRIHAQHRPLPQRDHPACGRHPAAAAAVAEPPFRFRAEQPRGAQQRSLLAAGVAARRAARRGRDPVPYRADPLRRWRRTAIPSLVDEQVIATTLAKETADPDSPVAGVPSTS